MKRLINANITLLLVAMAAVIMMTPQQTLAADTAKIETESRAALEELYKTVPAAGKIAETAEAVLVFPSILKAGLIIGGQGGNGALFVDGKVEGYYNIAAVSYGLQAGAQQFGYAMFLMTDAAREYLDKSEGWEVGVGPSIVVVDDGLGKSLTSTTAKDDVYAFIFGQSGLMAGLGVQGSKITKLDP